MILSRENLTCIAGIFLLGLASCRNVPQLSHSPNAISQPTTESTPSENIAESNLETKPEDPETVAVSEDDIWSQLRQADTHYYVLMRHAIAPGTGDPPSFQIGDCSTQRNLSEAGITQARRTGDAFRAQMVAVQQVLSSEWCRCLDTATAMALGPVEPFPALNSFFENRAKEPEQTQMLREFMITHQDKRGVTVLVTHFVNIIAIADSGASSGEIVVMQVNGQNEPEVVAQIEPF